MGSGRVVSCRGLPPQHQDAGEPSVYAIDTVQVNGQEKYLIVSAGGPQGGPGVCTQGHCPAWPRDPALCPSVAIPFSCARWLRTAC